MSYIYNKKFNNSITLGIEAVISGNAFNHKRITAETITQSHMASLNNFLKALNETADFKRITEDLTHVFVTQIINTLKIKCLQPEEKKERNTHKVGSATYILQTEREREKERPFKIKRIKNELEWDLLF